MRRSVADRDPHPLVDRATWATASRAYRRTSACSSRTGSQESVGRGPTISTGSWANPAARPRDIEAAGGDGNAGVEFAAKEQRYVVAQDIAQDAGDASGDHRPWEGDTHSSRPYTRVSFASIPGGRRSVCSTTQ